MLFQCAIFHSDCSRIVISSIINEVAHARTRWHRRVLDEWSLSPSFSLHMCDYCTYNSSSSLVWEWPNICINRIIVQCQSFNTSKPKKSSFRSSKTQFRLSEFHLSVFKTVVKSNCRSNLFTQFKAFNMDE